MAETYFKVLAHGGAGSDNAFKDGPETACLKILNQLKQGKSVLDSACLGVVSLEDDGRFNAGVGSRTRANGAVQMDASCMDSAGGFGAVAAMEGFKNPVLAARLLVERNEKLLAGSGAEDFAREQGLEVFPGSVSAGGADNAGTDTVGCVVFDGKTFASALSTGGTGGSPAGRVGDVPLIGCGLYAGPYGAVAATGKGEAIALNMTAFRAYQMMEEGMGPQFVLEEVLDWFEEDEDIGLLLVNRKSYAAGSNRSMAWAVME